MALVPSQYEGQLNDRYADLIDPRPESNTVRDTIKYVPDAEKSGDNYTFPVLMSDEQGVTYSNTGDSATLNAAIAAVSKKASISAPDLAIAIEVPYSIMLRNRNGNGTGQSAALDIVDDKVKSMLRSLGNVVEADLLHGCGTGATAVDNLGLIDAVPVKAGGGTTWASCTAQFTRKSFIHFLWDNSQNALFSVLNSAGDTELCVVKCNYVVDKEQCQVSFTGVSGTTSTTVAANHQLVRKGALGASPVGLQGQIVNTTTFAGINAGSFPKHRGNVKSLAGSALTRAKLFGALAGLPATQDSGSRSYVAWVSSMVFADLAEETHAQVNYFQTGTGAIESKEVGTNELVFKSPKAVVRVLSCDLQKQGQATIIDPSVCVRIGGSDITMRGYDGQNITLHLPDKTAFQMRALSQQAALIRQMNTALTIKDIISTYDFIPSAS